MKGCLRPDRTRPARSWHRPRQWRCDRCPRRRRGSPVWQKRDMPVRLPSPPAASPALYAQDTFRNPKPRHRHRRRRGLRQRESHQPAQLTSRKPKQPAGNKIARRARSQNSASSGRPVTQKWIFCMPSPSHRPPGRPASTRRSGCMTAQPTSLSVVSLAPGFTRGPAIGRRAACPPPR
jgi:hypothetical protein